MRTVRATVKSFRITPEESETFDKLCDLLEQSNESEALRVVFHGGLQELRLQAAIHLYTTTSKGTGEIAELVNIDRGTLLRLLQDRRIQPLEPPGEPSIERSVGMQHEIQRQMQQWPKPPNDPTEDH